MALVEQVAMGIYIGILTGMFTALLVFGLAFTFHYMAGVAFPANMGLMIGLGSAGLQGGLFRLMRDPTMLQSPTIITALLIVLLITSYSQKRGQDLAKGIPPKSVLTSGLRRRTLAPDVVRQLGRFGQITVTVAGEVADLEGYPPLPEDVRAAIKAGKWTFPADLPLAELERRLRDKLKVEHRLDEVMVAIDERGEATISAAPPASGLSRRVPAGMHATTVEATVPTGTAYGDQVELTIGDEEVDGTIVSVTPPEAAGADGEGAGPSLAQTAAGGEERVALAVAPTDVGATLGASVDQFVVRPRGQNREYELVSLLRRQGNAFRKIVVTPDGALVDRPLSELAIRSRFGVDVLAVRSQDSWSFAPDGRTILRGGDELFVTGPADAITGMEAAVT